MGWNHGGSNGGGETIIEKQNMYVNVKDFGALGNGTGNDAPFIQAAIDFAKTSKRRVVFFPAGIYRCTGGLKITSRNIRLLGETGGYGYTGLSSDYFYDYTCVLKFTGTAAGTIGIDNMYDYWTRFLASDSLAYQSLWSNTTIENIAIDGGGVLATGIRLAGANVVKNCTVSFCASEGIQLGYDTNQTHINNCNISNNTGKGIALYSHNDVGTQTTFTVNQSNIRENEIGVYMEVGEGALFKNCVIESNKSYGVHINIVSKLYFKWLTFEDCWFENNSSADRAPADGTPAVKETTDLYHLVVEKTGATAGDPLVVIDRCRFSCQTVTPNNRAMWVKSCQAMIIRNIQTAGGHAAPYVFDANEAKNIQFEGHRVGGPASVKALGKNTTEQRYLKLGDTAPRYSGIKTDGDNWITGSLYVDGKIDFGTNGLYLKGITSLPAASSAQRGRFIMLEGATGVADAIYTCVKLADDSYEWIQIQ